MATKGRGNSSLELDDVHRRMLDKITLSKLERRDAQTLKFTTHTAVSAKSLKLPVAKAGFKIPYFNIDGAPRDFFRFRYLEDTRTGFSRLAGTKPLRYAQPPNSPVEIYLPPLVDWREIFSDATYPIMITEGELKAACATKFGIATIGLGGVWSFQAAKKGEAMLPIFDELALEGRQVYICYDSDGATNPKVVAAESRLAQRLLERGAIIGICRLKPEVVGEESATPVKIGVDDYIALHGADSFREEVLNNAFEFEASEALHAMNERVVFVRSPGLVWEHKGAQKVSPAMFKESLYSNHHHFERKQTATGEKLVKTPTAKAWMEWEHRAECTRLVFQPGAERITEAGELNMWSGWGVPEPMAGDISEWERILDHLFGSDVAARTYFERWCAYPFQHPGVKMNVAAAIWGSVHGSGKSLVGYTLMRIYGDAHSAELKDANLESTRNDWAENKQFVLADDITSRGDRKFMRRLMTMVTQKKMMVDIKYVPSFSLADCINYYFTSNDPDALFMDDEDRRFFVHEVLSGKFVDPHSYVAWMESASGIAALWAHLLTLDMGDFDPYAPAPETIGKSSMIEIGKSEIGAFVLGLRQNMDIVLERAKIKGDLVSAKQLHHLFDPNGEKRASVNAVARELKRAGFKAPANGHNLRLSDGQQIPVYAVRNTDKWAKASWRDACDHYEQCNPQLTAPVARKKF